MSLTTLYVDILSVREFGAVGDGTTDDTTAMQEAIDTACANRKALFFPSGVYRVSNLTLPADDIDTGDPITFIGEGSQQSILKLTASATPILSLSVTGKTIRPSLKGLGFDGSPGSGSNDLLIIDNTEYAQYEDIYVTDSPGDGIADSNSESANYLNLRVENSSGKGIVLTYADGARLINARFNNNTSDDLDVDSNSSNCVFNVLPAPPNGAYTLQGETNNILLFDGKTQYITDDTVTAAKLETTLRQKFAHITWGSPAYPLPPDGTATITGTVEDENQETIEENVIFAVRMIDGNYVTETNKGKITDITLGTALSPENQPTVAVQTTSNGRITLKMALNTGEPTTTFKLITSPTYAGQHFYRDTDSPPAITIHPT